MVVKVDVLTYEEVSLFIGGELNVSVKSTCISKMPSQRSFTETANSYSHLLGSTFWRSIPGQQLANSFWLSKICGSSCVIILVLMKNMVSSHLVLCRNLTITDETVFFILFLLIVQYVLYSYI